MIHPSRAVVSSASREQHDRRDVRRRRPVRLDALPRRAVRRRTRTTRARRRRALAPRPSPSTNDRQTTIPISTKRIGDDERGLSAEQIALMPPRGRERRALSAWRVRASDLKRERDPVVPRVPEDDRQEHQSAPRARDVRPVVLETPAQRRSRRRTRRQHSGGHEDRRVLRQNAAPNETPVRAHHRVDVRESCPRLDGAQNTVERAAMAASSGASGVASTSPAAASGSTLMMTAARIARRSPPRVAARS